MLQKRDNQAFGYLYDHYSGALYSIILQILDDTEAASDVLQEVFVSIWRKMDSYDHVRGRLFTWMLNIARHAAIDILRSRSYQQGRKNQITPENVDVETAGFTSQPDIDNIGLKKMVGRLKPEYRVLIELSYFRGYTHEEIAVLEGIPLGTVKTRIRNALIQMRDYLK